MILPILIVYQPVDCKLEVEQRIDKICCEILCESKQDIHEVKDITTTEESPNCAH